MISFAIVFWHEGVRIEGSEGECVGVFIHWLTNEGQFVDIMLVCVSTAVCDGFLAGGAFAAEYQSI